MDQAEFDQLGPVSSQNASSDDRADQKVTGKLLEARGIDCGGCGPDLVAPVGVREKLTFFKINQPETYISFRIPNKGQT